MAGHRGARQSSPRRGLAEAPAAGRAGDAGDTANGNEADAAHISLVAADIKRFLDRPAETARMMTTTAAPPGAPIGGDVPQNWLATPVWCVWDEQH